MSNYVGNYGGPGVISLMSGTIIPANNYMVGSATNPADGSAGLNLYPGATWGPIRIASITDGTSNTGLISERLVGIPSPYPGTVAAAGQNLTRCAIRSPIAAAVGSGAAGALNFVQACASVPGTKGIRFCGNAEQWLSGFPSWLVWQSYNHFGTPNQVNCTNPADPKDPAGSNPVGYYVTPLGSAPPSSLHPGGVNVAFADGSVHFIKNTVAPNAWWALGSRSVGEVVSSDQY
jgi:prepilin-type processing-associated H-X9-DG protein